MNAYTRLEEHFKKIADFEHASGILQWDHAVMMPPGSAGPRGEAMATLAVHLHQLHSDPRIVEWADSVRERGLDPWQAANLREIRRLHTMHTALPEDLVAALSRATSSTEHAWRELRAANDWQAFQPLLEEIFALTREQGQVLGEALGIAPYDALLALYQSGISCSEIDPIFDELSDFLPGVVERAVARQDAEGELPPPATGISAGRQRELALAVTGSLGYDFQQGRLDTAHHPFCGGATGDTRITTRYSEDNFLPSLLGVIHETGHALYEQNRPRKYLGQPVSEAMGMAMHESQSLFMEMQVANNGAYIEHLVPLMRHHLAPEADPATQTWSPRYLSRLVTRVEPGLIRVDADECTYHAHIILRYEMEKDLIQGDLTVADIPAAWDAGMQRLLGLSTGDDYRDGCMQDVHWPSGCIGYFPTYTLGAIIAAQLKVSMQAELPAMEAQLAAGDLSAVKSWLHDRVWSQGSRYELQDLLVHATGKPLGVADFKAHISARYDT